MASILGPAIHLGHLYGASHIAEVLNAAVGDDAKAIDATALLRVFSNDAADVCVLPTSQRPKRYLRIEPGTPR